MNKLKIEIISPEEVVLQAEADSLTLVAEKGEITILPGHVPLFTQIKPGEVKIINDRREQYLVINQGFLNVEPGNRITLLTDYAVRSENIEIAQVQEAKNKAEKVMKEKRSKQDFIAAEAELRRALLELKVARRGTKNKTSGH